MTLEVLFDLWFSVFLNERPHVLDAMSEAFAELAEACNQKKDVKLAHQKLLMVVEQLNLEKQLTDFDNSHSSYPMYLWARMYMKQVMNLLNFIRSLKNPNLFLYLGSLENLCKYFFSYNRLDYAQNITEYLARVDDAQTSDKSVWETLSTGGFALKANEIHFTGIGIDQGQEFLNKVLKGEGGLKGITNRPATLLKFCLSVAEVGRVAAEFEELVGMNPSSRKHHHHLTPALSKHRDTCVQQLTAALEGANPFADISPRLHNVLTNQVLPENIEQDILNMEMRGQQALKSCVDQQNCGPINL